MAQDGVKWRNMPPPERARFEVKLKQKLGALGRNPTLSASFFAPSRFFQSESGCAAAAKTR